jgi:hypothetical protein
MLNRFHAKAIKEYNLNRARRVAGEMSVCNVERHGAVLRHGKVPNEPRSVFVRLVE